MANNARRIAIIGIATAGSTLAVASLLLEWSPIARASIIGAVCVLLWLTELLPMWMPSIVLAIGASVLLWPLGNQFAPHNVVRWALDPVLALFLGGFSFALAAERRGVDRAIVDRALQLARGNARRLVVIAALVTALLSMWISNVAAAALVLGALRTVTDGTGAATRINSALLLGVALAADVAGIATPVGSGPNGIAIASLSGRLHIDFLHWMAFGVPLAAGLLLFVLIVAVRRVPAGTMLTLDAHRATPQEDGQQRRSPDQNAHTLSREGEGAPQTTGNRAQTRILTVLFLATLTLWLTEPAHGLAAWKVALAVPVSLLVTRVIAVRDFVHLDWGTLLLVAGGIAFGTMLDRVGVMDVVAPMIRLDALPRPAALFAVCLVSALFSALMSNTATATLLVPLSLTIDPSPATAILVAVSCSMGVPFVISTPPNAMAVSHGLRSRELLGPGLLIMIGGCALVALTGHRVLGFLGIE